MAREDEGLAALAPPRRLSSSLQLLEVTPATTALSPAAKRLVNRIDALRPPFPTMLTGQTAGFLGLEHSLAARLPLAAGLDPETRTRAADARPTMRGMAAEPKVKPRGPWTREEIARNERANQVRARREREQTPEQRLEETLRVSRFVSELRQGVPDDVRAR